MQQKYFLQYTVVEHANPLDELDSKDFQQCFQLTKGSVLLLLSVVKCQ